MGIKPTMLVAAHNAVKFQSAPSLIRQAATHQWLEARGSAPPVTGEGA